MLSAISVVQVFLFGFRHSLFAIPHSPIPNPQSPILRRVPYLHAQSPADRFDRPHSVPIASCLPAICVHLRNLRTTHRPTFSLRSASFAIRYSPSATRNSLLATRNSQLQAITRYVLYTGPEPAPGVCARLPRRTAHERNPIFPNEAIFGGASVVLHDANPLPHTELRPTPPPRPVTPPPNHRAKRTQTNSFRHAARSRAPPRPPAWITRFSAARNRFRPA